MAVSSEFILAPRINQQEVRKEMEKVEAETRRAAQQAADDFEYWFGQGFERGADKGADKVKSKLTKLQGFMMLTGANLASEAIMAAGSAAKDIATKAFQGAEEYAQLAKERLNEMSDISDTADALGIDRGRYAALSAVGISARLDQSDIRGILSGFVGALENPEMTEYKRAAETNGIENAFLDFIGTMSQLEPEKAAQYMNQIFGDEDALLASRFMEPFREIMSKNGELSFQNIIDTMNGEQVRTEAMGNALDEGEDSANILARGDSKAFQKRIIDGVDQNQAQSIVDVEASEARRIQAHLDVLDLKVKGKILADTAEIKAIETEDAIIKGAISFADESASRWKELFEAGNQPVSAESMSDFIGKLIEWGTYSPLESATGESLIDKVLNYAEKEGASINSLMVEIAEKESANNKSRTDVGPLK
ncbi:conserved hypothetical protein [Vibrio owensii]|uniref:Uncharacterized protein n=1 Tax=Vibrio owensii TaxID=696485 RepID=A0AAU9PYM6_9VIBR|nr:conserved hypothetical protein [Vibrio owensii]